MSVRHPLYKRFSIIWILSTFFCLENNRH
jgi:hypothetical protein